MLSRPMTLTRCEGGAELAKENLGIASASASSAIGERSVGGTLAALLALTSDAVLVFDGAGRVLLANDEAERLFDKDHAGLIGTDIRTFFPPAPGVATDAPFEPLSLPFPLDGRSTPIASMTSDGHLHEVVVRCDRVSAPGQTYLLVATTAAAAASEREHDRLVDELSRANHRLSGTLKIVLDTIDSEDVSTLFDNVLQEISETLEATGTLLYLADRDGYRLWGVSQGLQKAHAPRFLPYGGSAGKWVSQAGGTLMLRVMEPTVEELRRGHLSSRLVLDEGTRQTRRLPVSQLPPLTSMLVSPVWFSDHMIALINVGWDKTHQLRRDDARLLDAVGHYLSVQLAGALTTLRQQRGAELESAVAQVHLVLLNIVAQESEDIPGEAERQIFSAVSSALSADVVPVRENPYQRETVVASLPHAGERALPMGIDQLEASHPLDASVVPIGVSDELGAWLGQMGEAAQGAFVDFGMFVGQRRCLLVLRSLEEEPLDDMELQFLQSLVEDVRDVTHGAEASAHDRYISQALQTGMRNELQQVDGITSQGVYSSATKAAFVGGDFYDLICLPEHRGCIIMGDVSGKGVEAASVSAAVKTALGAYSWEGLRPARMVRLLNEFLLGFSRLETFATLFVGIINLESGKLTYCSAGHPPAIMVRAKTGDLAMLDVQSGVVGAFKDMDYRNGQAKVSPGDVLMLYTDGTTEARAADGSFFGEEGLRDALVEELPRGFSGLLDRLLTHLDDFTGRNLDDDVAMVALRFDEVGKSLSKE